MGKKGYNPEEHGYMPLPPVDDGEMLVMGEDEQIDLRVPLADEAFEPTMEPAYELAQEPVNEAESVNMLESLAATPSASEVAAPQVKFRKSVGNFAERLGEKVRAFGAALKTKATAFGGIVKAKTAAAVEKIRQNPAAAIASVAGVVVVVVLIVLVFIWVRPAGEQMQPDVIADDPEIGLPEGENQAEVASIADLVCYADLKTDKIYGFKDFLNLAVERHLTFAAPDMPNRLAVTNIFTFDETIATDKAKFDSKVAEYKKIFDAKYPSAERGFAITWSGTKAIGIEMYLTTEMQSEKLTDAQLLQFGLQPKLNAEGQLEDGYYSRAAIEQRWLDEGFVCAATEAIAIKD
ncbi:MAG: hypothetical protein LBM12_03115 [Candidatus Nomurabacteria bacterium]|jgi:hypothetical protein|nr:hypothetical protein [Candidatus Nomurabacteria bacterium]